MNAGGSDSSEERESIGTSCVSQNHSHAATVGVANDSVAGHQAKTKIMDKWVGWPGHHVFRLLISEAEVGRLIGPRGEYIQKICSDTSARIKILDGAAATCERIVLVSSKESPDLPLSPAMDATLRIHLFLSTDPCPRRIVHPLLPGTGETIATRLLVPPEHAIHLIGRGGATIRDIQCLTGARVQVLPLDAVPLCALWNDRVVEIRGNPYFVHNALHLIIAHLRKFLLDRSVLFLFEANRAMDPLRSRALTGQPSISPGPTVSDKAVVTNHVCNVRGSQNVVSDGFTNSNGRNLGLHHRLAPLHTLHDHHESKGHSRDLGMFMHGLDRDSNLDLPSNWPFQPSPVCVDQNQMVQHTQTRACCVSVVGNPTITNMNRSYGLNVAIPTTQASSACNLPNGTPDRRVHSQFAQQIPSAQQIDQIILPAAGVPRILTGPQIDQSPRAFAVPHIANARLIDQSFGAFAVPHTAAARLMDQSSRAAAVPDILTAQQIDQSLRAFPVSRIRADHDPQLDGSFGHIPTAQQIAQYFWATTIRRVPTTLRGDQSFVGAPGREECEQSIFGGTDEFHSSRAAGQNVVQLSAAGNEDTSQQTPSDARESADQHQLMHIKRDNR